MSQGSSSLPGRRWALLFVVALLGLAVASVTATAGASGGWQEAGATVAKKKCKKKKNHSASSAKKKCKKKKHVAPVVVPRGPIERIKLTWSGGADLDAHAWSSGLHDGWNEALDHYEYEIPGTTYEASYQTPNQERIVETNPNPSIRPMTFGLCYYAGDGGVDDGPVDATVTTVTTDGVSHTDVVNLDYGDALVDGLQQGGSPDPVSDWCPSPF